MALVQPADLRREQVMLARRAAALILLLLPVATPPCARADDRPVGEKAKIEALIKHIESLKDAVFVRNGREYDAKTAARFLRGKWDSVEDEVKTAKDFLDKAASVSSTTGQAYLIRFKDGREMKSGDYLLQELKKLEAAPRDKGKR
jgi:hypothetical protein